MWHAAIATASVLASASAFTVPAFLSGSRLKQSPAGEQFATVAPIVEEVGSTQTLEDYVKSRGGDRPIRKVLIANNGMAATKSILSMRQWAYMELGDERAIQFVAMPTPEDLKANAEFVRLADAYVEVPGGKNSNNYANVEVITRVAKQFEVDAVWPGWGHASENPKLPESLNALGIKFIGPPGPVMSVLGDKIAANILAQTAKVPSIPWSGSYGGPDDGPLQAELNEEGTIPDDVFEKATCRNVEEAIEAARKVGYENGIMIKASEGGGGKGIRFVDNEEDLANAYMQVSSEVVGSPIFIMQLCKNARHLEVQIVGDEHGNAVALSGRDCSTQRRFQKIFEEGPPVIAPPETFREMERAAQRLTQSIGYVGAGTVEYLFNADTGKFFFLELNPRLQVEHPVTEGITGVNLPATQLQVAMGIPLPSIPEIRRLYGKSDVYGTSGIDFMTEEYKPIESHVVAARITAENPDEGFKPTSGTIERIKFQSTPNVWGYFSVGSNGGIHEFADSQFGHLFAKGPTREQARKTLVLALKEIEVRGEIRTTVEYLVQLLEMDAFKENTIDTAWLDGLIKEKSVQVEKPQHFVVASAAIFKAFEHVKTETQNIVESFQKGQVGTGGIRGVTGFPIEIAYKDTKYAFGVELMAPDVYRMTINGSSFDVGVTLTAEGALLAKFGGETHRILGMDEPLGLRLVLDGVTILMPTIYDPSELRTDVTGKVVRYLQDNGANVNAGEPFVEVEAMKMIMPIKASESGKIAHNLSPGSIISAGDLLASLTLKDPSKVKKIVPHKGTLDIEDVPLDEIDGVKNILMGYKNDPDSVAQAAMAKASDIESLSKLITESLEAFYAVESLFDDKLLDDVTRDLIKSNTDSLQKVVELNLAHQQLSMRTKLIGVMLRQVNNFSDVIGYVKLTEDLEAALVKITSLSDKCYGELGLVASSILLESKVPDFETRKDELRDQLVAEGTNLERLSKSTTLSAGVDLLTSLFDDEDFDVRAAAVEVYCRRVYRAHVISDMVVEEIDGRIICDWSFAHSDMSTKESITRHGLLTVIQKAGDLKEALPGIITACVNRFTSRAKSQNVVLVAVLDNRGTVKEMEDAIQVQRGQLNMIGCKHVHLLIANDKKETSYYTLSSSTGYQENPLRRNMRPTFYDLLDLGRLAKDYDLERIDALQKNAQVYIGTQRGARAGRGAPPQVLFARGISHTGGITTSGGAMRAMLGGLDELERAQSKTIVTPNSSSRIFLNYLPEIEEVSAGEMSALFAGMMSTMKARLAKKLLKLRVDEIELKVRINTVDENGDSKLQPLRLIASSMEGEWLKTSTFTEVCDPETGQTKVFCDVEDSESCFVDPYVSSSIVQTKRAIARRVGSTYAYDFLGLLEVGLIEEWDTYLKSTNEIKEVAPSNIFKSEELTVGEDGEISVIQRTIGENKVGMIAWLVSMKTPEYPEGRDVIFIANDVTVQSGSFGVEEDEIYFKASEFARQRKIPRVYIACNAGARIGLVDELKSKFNIKFHDNNNPSKGFEYLYLTDADYQALPEEMVNARKVPEGWAIDDIIGTQHGIGVENLQGSGMIAGETSRAYDEIFTLSYVTGRSVGIGAYLVRLGHRVIQMDTGPMILTGYSALNKLLGKDVYTSQDQLGGPQIMVPNGVTHEQVPDDQAGVASILKWLSFVPDSVGALPASRKCSDPVDRKVAWRPTPTPYDPRLMLTGEGNDLGFFDQNSFKEYLSGWGKSVVVGRARLGGIPMGAIAVETRLVEQIVPADPADPNSREAVLPQAGQVLFPDSSYKTAQAIRDFANEGLPIMLFANWRGFSGGSRDMAGEILKFGAMIVDALREYKHPIFIYLPPHGELRGGSWVVVDPTINQEKMSMYADPDSRGGILEPAGIVEIKFRIQDQIKVMHRLDDQLLLLDQEFELTDMDSQEQQIVKDQIAAREDALKPVYTQAATMFADLHDKTGRMRAKGVIEDAVPWETSREYFYYLAKRRILQDDLVDKIKEANDVLATDAAIDILKSACETDGVSWGDNMAVIAFFEASEEALREVVATVQKDAIKNKIEALQSQLDGM